MTRLNPADLLALVLGQLLGVGTTVAWTYAAWLCLATRHLFK